MKCALVLQQPHNSLISVSKVYFLHIISPTASPTKFALDRFTKWHLKCCTLLIAWQPLDFIAFSYKSNNNNNDYKINAFYALENAFLWSRLISRIYQQRLKLCPGDPCKADWLDALPLQLLSQFFEWVIFSILS